MQTCIHCEESFSPNPKVKNQRYCSKRGCQRARRTRWYKKKIVNDQDYKDNQRRCQKQWHKFHPAYYREYRAAHPLYVKRNRILQLKRNARRRKGRIGKLIAKIDALDNKFLSRKGEMVRVIPQQHRMIAKIDSFVAKLIPYKELGNYR